MPASGNPTWAPGDLITAAKLNNIESALDVVYNHTEDQNNPHNVTPAQIGAIPASEKGAVGGVAELDANARVPRSITGTAASLWDSGTVGAANPVLVRVNGALLEWSNDGGGTWNPAGQPLSTIAAYALAL